jgi:hypothetical protein
MSPWSANGEWLIICETVVAPSKGLFPCLLCVCVHPRRYREELKDFYDLNLKQVRPVLSFL